MLLHYTTLYWVAQKFLQLFLIYQFVDRSVFFSAVKLRNLIVKLVNNLAELVQFLCVKTCVIPHAHSVVYNDTRKQHSKRKFSAFKSLEPQCVKSNRHIPQAQKASRRPQSLGGSGPLEPGVGLGKRHIYL